MLVAFVVRANLAVEKDPTLLNISAVFHRLTHENFDSIVLESFKGDRSKLKKGWIIMLTEAHDCLLCAKQEVVFG